MSKLANLYYLSPKNGIWILLLSVLLINTSFSDDKKKTDFPGLTIDDIIGNMKILDKWLN